MKIGIIGNGALALETSAFFYNIGADVKLFAPKLLSYKLETNVFVDGIYKKNFEDLQTNWSKELLSDSKKAHNLKDYILYLEDIRNFLNRENIIKGHDVVRVHKRFLRTQKTPSSGKSRLQDLFRVVYKIDASKEIENQDEQNKEIFEKLGKEVVDSLKDAIESYEDFDIIINATNLHESQLPMGPGDCYAINEKAVSKNENIIYGADIFSKDLSLLFKDKSTISLIGDDLVNLALLGPLLEEFKENKSLKVQLITESQAPFMERSDEGMKFLIDKFNNFLNYNQVEFDTLIKEFEEKTQRWRSLEDYVRAKSPKPAEPTSRLFIFNGAAVTSVDKLLDQKGLFLTIEGSEILGSLEQLRTISTDLIIVNQGSSILNNFENSLNLDNSKHEIINDSEPGYFRLKSGTLEKNLHNIKKIENELMKYFSKEVDND